MSEVIIDTSKIKVKVDNNGIITFISVSDDGEICTVFVHPFDTGLLAKFLVDKGYNFSK